MTPISFFHCSKIAGGVTIRVAEEDIVDSVDVEKSEKLASPLRCKFINAIISTVLPKPISSAKIPPLSSEVVCLSNVRSVVTTPKQ